VTGGDSAAEPAYQALAHTLRARILSGELRPGDRLPVEPDLSARYGVSRSTVREALRVLSSQHLVTTSRGVSGGSFVAHPNVEQIAEHLELGLDLLTLSAEVSMEQLLEIREMIEVPAAALAAARIDEPALRELAATLVDANATPPATLHVCNHRFHSLVLRAAANPLLDLVSRPVFQVLEARFSQVDGQHDFFDAVMADHREIHRALAAGDAAAAGAASAAHLTRLRPTYEKIDRSGNRNSGTFDRLVEQH
jgi:GntR family transcriptional regulator, transcriptional repressor for pyruvate dehydrogenase complex